MRITCLSACACGRLGSLCAAESSLPALQRPTQRRRRTSPCRAVLREVSACARHVAPRHHANFSRLSISRQRNIPGCRSDQTSSIERNLGRGECTCSGQGRLPPILPAATSRARATGGPIPSMNTSSSTTDSVRRLQRPAPQLDVPLVNRTRSRSFGRAGRVAQSSALRAHVGCGGLQLRAGLRRSTSDRLCRFRLQPGWPWSDAELQPAPLLVTVTHRRARPDPGRGTTGTATGRRGSWRRPGQHGCAPSRGPWRPIEERRTAAALPRVTAPTAVAAAAETGRCDAGRGDL